MGLFKQRRPRGFQHQYLYADERKDVLKDVEERAKRELGVTDDKGKSSHEDRIRGTFLNATKYARRRSERRLSGGVILSTGVILLLIVLLVVVWKFLLYFN